MYVSGSAFSVFFKLERSFSIGHVPIFFVDTALLIGHLYLSSLSLTLLSMYVYVSRHPLSTVKVCWNLVIVGETVQDKSSIGQLGQYLYWVGLKFIRQELVIDLT